MWERAAKGRAGMAQTTALDVAEGPINNALYFLGALKTDGRKVVSEVGKFCEIVPVGPGNEMQLL